MSLTALSQREAQEIKLVFDLVDQNTDGFISSQEIGVALRGLGCLLTEADLGELRIEITKNYGDRVSFEDFSRIYSLKRQDSLNEDTVLEFFNTFDRNKDGFIDIAELKSMLLNLGEPMTEAEVIQVMQDFDKNQDGRLSIAEFARNLTRKDLSLR
mmetsp:Transcript_7752/g.14722  ORF Transcript_7752/g.14722 Transcript_7752/m.14722 type:complete len:156 (+) Transcript_7752:1437-1904(+)